jgi:hypothetical protein
MAFNQTWCFAGGANFSMRSAAPRFLGSRSLCRLRCLARASLTSVERTATAVIEIELAGGHRLRADASIDVAVLRA